MNVQTKFHGIQQSLKTTNVNIMVALEEKSEDHQSQ